MKKSWECVCMDFFAVEIQRHQSSLGVLTKELQFPCGSNSAAETFSCVFATPNSWHGELWVGEQRQLWQHVRRSHWAPQNLSDMRGRTWHVRSQFHPPWDTQAGQGEWGRRLPALFAPSAPSKGESCAGQWFTELVTVMRREAVANICPIYNMPQICADLRSTGDDDERSVWPEALSLCLGHSGSAAQKAHSKPLQITGQWYHTLWVVKYIDTAPALRQRRQTPPCMQLASTPTVLSYQGQPAELSSSFPSSYKLDQLPSAAAGFCLQY